MNLEVYWTRIAVNKLFAIMEHYRSIEGSMAASELLNGLIEGTIDLEENPYLGQPETSLSDLPQNFRCLKHQNFRVLYWINEKKNRIEVASIFETRQNPEEFMNIR